MSILGHKRKGDVLTARQYNKLVEAINNPNYNRNTIKKTGDSGIIKLGANIGPVGLTGIVTRHMPVLIVNKVVENVIPVLGVFDRSINITRSQEGNDLTMFAVALDTIMVGFAGRVMVSGVCWVWTDCADPSLKKAIISPSYTDRMVLTNEGGIADVISTQTIPAQPLKGIPAYYAAEIRFPITGEVSGIGEVIEAHSHATTQYGHIPGTIGTS